MKNEFYLTLPSNSSLADYPNNSSNNFKVRLPAPIRLNGEWKVALASISVPDPKNSLPDWLTDSLPLVYATWYNADSSDSNQKLLDASFLLRDIKDHVDINRLTGIEFMENVFHFLKKKRYFKDSRTNRMYGNSDTNKAYFTEFKVDGDDIILDSSKTETCDFGRGDEKVDRSFEQLHSPQSRCQLEIYQLELCVFSRVWKNHTLVICLL